MSLSAPKQLTFWIAIILGVLGIVGHFVTLPFITTYEYWLLLVGFVVLALGNLMEGL
jgi:putative Ca2+/H+ antiporter (TMEM165/GDT1 family)